MLSISRRFNSITLSTVVLLALQLVCSRHGALGAPFSVSSRPGPNEAGEVPILEYHNITTDLKVGIYDYPAVELRRDMEFLYAHNYRPISLSDYVNGRIYCPDGTSPVVITFDDASSGQFKYEPNGSIDPNCAVGILDSMNSEHPGWKSRATFFVLTNEDPKMPAPFTKPQLLGFPSQKRLAADKMAYLVRDGFEIGNHTLHHSMNMRSMSSLQVQAEFAGGAEGIQRYLPGYNVQTLALPYGRFPNDSATLRSGQSGGYFYHNICAMAAGWEPAPSPMSKDFHPYRLPRIIPGNNLIKPGGMNTIRYWLEQLEENPSDKFVSDGDPNTFSVPESLVRTIDLTRLKEAHMTLRVCSPLAERAGP